MGFTSQFSLIGEHIMTEVQRWYQAFRPLILVCVQYIPSDNKVDFGIVNAAVGPFRGSPRFYQVLPVLFPFRLKPIGSVWDCLMLRGNGPVG